MQPEEKTSQSTPSNLFLKRMTRNLITGLTMILISLGIGMTGYHHFEKMSWMDAYVNAAMILSGMGPVSPLQTDMGKLFAGTYALFSGILFLVIIALIFGPLVHRFFHKMHLEDTKK
ncbi:MAG: hypothetical protein LLG04_04905 [Parachlamydia sp.]|nr:hypothetical protein [Parachlamydia sp.]